MKYILVRLNCVLLFQTCIDSVICENVVLSALNIVRSVFFVIDFYAF